MRAKLGLLWTLAIAGLSLPACGSKSLSPVLGTGTGGLGATRGSAGATGGYVGTGGGDPTGPFPDPWADGGICNHVGQPPVDPWYLAPPNSLRDFGPDAGASGCAQKPSVSGIGIDVACSGDAWLRSDPKGPILTWDDGSRLTWSTLGWVQSLDPPAMPAGDQRVWASRTAELHPVGCATCDEQYSNVLTEVREREGGPLLMLIQTGFNLPDLNRQELTDLFGADAEARSACSFQGGDGCSSVTVTVQDHLLHTNPGQVIPPDQSTTVSAPTGTFEVIWYAESEQMIGVIPNCVDGPQIGPSFGFVASRVAAPAP